MAALLAATRHTRPCAAPYPLAHHMSVSQRGGAANGSPRIAANFKVSGASGMHGRNGVRLPPAGPPPGPSYPLPGHFDEVHAAASAHVLSASAGALVTRFVNTSNFGPFSSSLGAVALHETALRQCEQALWMMASRERGERGSQEGPAGVMATRMGAVAGIGGAGGGLRVGEGSAALLAPPRPPRAGFGSGGVPSPSMGPSQGQSPATGSDVTTIGHRAATASTSQTTVPLPPFAPPSPYPPPRFDWYDYGQATPRQERREPSSGPEAREMAGLPHWLSHAAPFPGLGAAPHHPGLYSYPPWMAPPYAPGAMGWDPRMHDAAGDNVPHHRSAAPLSGYGPPRPFSPGPTYHAGYPQSFSSEEVKPAPAGPPGVTPRNVGDAASKRNRKRKAPPVPEVLKCSVADCSAEFTDRNELMAHGRTHTEERPFLCTHDGCPKAFKTLGSREAHLRTHTGEKPFKCPFKDCPARFGQRSSCNRHIRLLHGDWSGTHTG